MAIIVCPYRINHDSLVFAISPIFSHQVITDAPHDWDISPADSVSNCTYLQKNKNIITYPDLESISYFSDGKTLNATLWLSGLFEEKPSMGEIPSYSMFININSFYGTRIPDYEVSIKWDPLSSTWNKVVTEWSANDTRVIYEKDNVTGFFDNDPLESGKAKGHVNLSLDLASINYPDSYLGYFSIANSFSYKNNHCFVHDDSDNALYVPIPQFTISTSPNSIDLRPGEEGKDVELRVNSTIHSTPKLSFFTNQTRGIEVDLIPKEERLTPAAMTTSFLHVKVLGNTTFRYHVPYTIQLLSNISFPKIDSNLIKGINKNNRMSATIPLQPSYLTVTILPPLQFSDYFKNLWDAWGSPIGFFYTLITTIGVGVSSWIINKIRKGRKEDKHQKSLGDFS